MLIWRDAKFWTVLVLTILSLDFGWISDPAAGAGLSTSTEQCTPRRVRLSNETLLYIFKKYGASSRAFWVGKFLPSMTEGSLRQMISEAVAKGHARTSTHGPFGTLYEYAFPFDIGHGTLGNPTRWLRVIVGPDNDVATAYPD
jgi:hypothetical protein